MRINLVQKVKNSFIFINQIFLFNCGFSQKYFKRKHVFCSQDQH